MMARMNTYDIFMQWIRNYAKIGWKVALLQAMIFLVWLAMYAAGNYLFGDVKTPTVNSFLDYLLFPIILAVIFTMYLVVNGWVAKNVFKWK